MQQKRLAALLAAMGMLCSLLAMPAAGEDAMENADSPSVSGQAGEEEDGGQQTEEEAEPEPGTPQAILDGAELAPSSAQSEQLQELVEGILDEIIEEDMDTYEKVKACYDYVSQNTSYGSHMRRLSTAVGDTTCGEIYRQFGELEGFGAVALSAKTGLCNAYASAFLLLVRPLGLSGALVSGQTRSGGGGYAYHEWAEIDIGDTTYLFDPQLEQDLVAAGLPAYTVFCRTYEQVPGRYIRACRK